jgi:hypothetical protein
MVQTVVSWHEFVIDRLVRVANSNDDTVPAPEFVRLRSVKWYCAVRRLGLTKIVVNAAALFIYAGHQIESKSQTEGCILKAVRHVELGVQHGTTSTLLTLL